MDHSELRQQQPCDALASQNGEGLQEGNGQGPEQGGEGEGHCPEDAGDLPGPEEAGEPFRSLGSSSVPRRSGSDGNDADPDARASHSELLDVRRHYCPPIGRIIVAAETLRHVLGKSWA